MSSRRSARTCQMWHRAIKVFKAEEEEHDGEAATLVLMWLAIKGEDYAYNMAKIFKKELIVENGWAEEQLAYLRSLKKPSQVGTLLSKMEKEGFVASRKEQTGRRNKYYALNVNMLCCYIKDERFRKSHYDSPKSKALHFDEAKDKSTVSEFQKELAKRDLTGYLSRWSIIKKFDFFTFLAFLREEAKKMNDEDMVRIITENISNIHEIEKAVQELKFRSEYLKRSALDNEARKIYKAQTAAEKLSDAIE
jgi:DNA-binding transcriptional ArsR family regulator